MSKLKTLKLIVLVCSLGLTACTRESSIYGLLGPEQDGVVAVTIPDNNQPPPKKAKKGLSKNQLTTPERKLVINLHNSEFDKLSFFVVDVDSKKVLKDYFAEKPQRLASVTKISTALGALENLQVVNVGRIAEMLKISNNGSASRYVRLAAKAIDNYETPGQHYTQKHSCPDAFLDEEVAGDVVLTWLKEQLPNVDWTDASLNDGAGCHYDNFMSSIQVAKILEFAESLGDSFDGQSFEDLLSINGVDGTLKNKNLDNKGAIFGKTGTLRPNANLSGYFYAKRNNKMRKFYFSIFVEKRGGGQFSTNARKMIEGLLRYWIDYYAAYEGDSLGQF